MSIDLHDQIPGEKVVCEVRAHRVQLLLPSIVVGLLILIAAFLVRGAISPHGSFGGTAILVVGALTFAIIAVAVAANTLLDWQSRKVVLTNKRLVVRSGVLEERTSSILLGVIESVAVQEGPLGKTFEFGTVILRDRKGTEHRLKKIMKPGDFLRNLQGQMGRGDE